MRDSADLKIDRAQEHINELEQLLNNQRPFRYMVTTNLRNSTREGSTIEDNALVTRISLLLSDTVHNLRTALDHAYWEIVSPFAHTEAERRRIQFPYCESAARMEDELKSRLADRVSNSFFNALKALPIFGEAGGNQYLSYIHRIDMIDKHRRLIPTAQATQMTRAILDDFLPDFPVMPGIQVTMISTIVKWGISAKTPNDIGIPTPKAPHVCEKIIDFPFEIVIRPPSAQPINLLDGLKRMKTETDRIVSIMRSS